MANICKHFYVSGHVQAVFYRAATQAKANELHLTGWVKNMPDGRVELKACGDAENINKLQEWLWEGSPRAQVTDVSSEQIPWEEYQAFSIKRDMI